RRRSSCRPLPSISPCMPTQRAPVVQRENYILRNKALMSPAGRIAARFAGRRGLTLSDFFNKITPFRRNPVASSRPLMTTFSPKAGAHKSDWYVVNADVQVLGRLAGE